MKYEKYVYKVGEQDLVIERNDWMSFTESSLVGSMGDTKVMVAIALGGKSDKDYMPLKVEYLERFYARGEILGSRFNKREGKPSTEATLSARVIDRSIRPYFPKGFNRDINVVVTVLSLGKYDPDIVALNTTALALELSTIPWDGPIASVRVARNDQGIHIINPTYKQREEAVVESVVATRAGRVVMVEFEGKELSETHVESMISDGVEASMSIIDQSRALVADYAQQSQELEHKAYDYQKEFVSALESLAPESLLPRSVEHDIYMHMREAVLEGNPEVDTRSVRASAEYFLKQYARSYILETKKHLDGRAHGQVRDIYAQAGDISPVIHGSGLFYRGETHVLSVATVGKLEDAQLINGMEIQTEKNYLHHYNFPSYSVGEVGRMGSPGRREIGHGALAEKGIRQVLPTPDVFPYTIRVVSEILSSNGSTSMASTCGSSLALMDAGVPIQRHVAGVAIGLVYESDEKYLLLTDILGKEDHWGDMDFKVAGTSEGVTAIQLDCKFHGLTMNMVSETLAAARSARSQIIDVMNGAISAPRELTEHVEKIEVMEVPKDKIGRVIGSGGVTIKKITKDSGAKIDIKRDGHAHISGSSESIRLAREAIATLL